MTLVYESSRTTFADDANSAQATEVPVPVIVQLRRRLPWSDPKNRDPDGVVSDDNDDDMSEGLIVPNIPTSRTGIEARDWKRIVVLAGGTVGEERTNSTRAVATLISGMEDI
jgi:hypothetical protein